MQIDVATQHAANVKAWALAHGWYERRAKELTKDDWAYMLEWLTLSESFDEKALNRAWAGAFFERSRSRALVAEFLISYVSHHSHLSEILK